MPVLPSTLGLTTIQTSAQILSADHRNNYSAIQTATNSLISAFGGGTTGQFLKGVGTTVSYDYPPGYEYAYNEFTAPISATGTEAIPTNAVTASSVTFDGSTAVVIEFYCESLQTAAVSGATIAVSLWDNTGSADLGRLAQVTSPAAAATLAPCVARRRVTPVAGARVYSIRCWSSGGTGTVNAGIGGAGTIVPGFVRITKV